MNATGNINLPVLLSLLAFALITVILFLFVPDKTIHERSKIRILQGFVGFFLLTYLIYSLTRFLERDEIEHIQSSWMVFKGMVPYHDFFQHHHPLLWYIMAPSFFLFGEGLLSVLFLRMLNDLIFLAILYIIFRIARELLSSGLLAWISVSAILSVNIFSRNAMAIRPDVPMTLFILWSFFLFLRFVHTRRNYFLVFSGVTLALSFIFLQKAAFFILPFMVAVGYLWIIRFITFRQVTILGLSALVPVVIFILIWHLNGYFKDYLVYNWFYNFEKPSRSSFFQTFDNPAEIMVAASFLLILILTGWGFVRWFRQTSRLIKIIFFSGLFMLLFISGLSTVYIHYYLPVIPLLLLPSSLYLHRFFTRFDIPDKFQILFLFVLYSFTIPAQVKKISQQSVFSQMEINKKIIRELGEEGTALTNYPAILFSRHPHFFFFMAEPADAERLTLEKVIDNQRYKSWITDKMTKDAEFDPADIIINKGPGYVVAGDEFIQHHALENILLKNYVSGDLDNSYRLKKD